MRDHFEIYFSRQALLYFSRFGGDWDILIRSDAEAVAFDDYFRAYIDC